MYILLFINSDTLDDGRDGDDDDDISDSPLNCGPTEVKVEGMINFVSYNIFKYNIEIRYLQLKK